MNKSDIDILKEQIKNIILGNPLSEQGNPISKELEELEEGIHYLSKCLCESNEFLRQLCIGNLNVTPPGRYNFMAANLKELHSDLKYLTWQTNQVANGDYNQHVNFLGDFSSSFNQMIHQLSERELQLQKQSTMLTETVDFMKAIVDGLKNWVIVTSAETDEIIYANQSGHQMLSELTAEQNGKIEYHGLLNYILKFGKMGNKEFRFKHQCILNNQVLNVQSCFIQWNDKLAYAHYIVDVTHYQKMAYTDELTGLFNRRYCMSHLEILLSQRTELSFCMLDLDSLKYANDNFGHLAGDHYLKVVANEMLKLTRSSDIACRIGGDEFAILFPNCTAQVVLEKMKYLNYTIGHMSENFPMSISYGVVHVKKGAQISAATVMAQADEKMYILKNTKK